MMEATDRQINWSALSHAATTHDQVWTMSSDDWYFGVGTENGPVPKAELARLLAEGPLGPDTWVWHESLLDWTRAKDIPDFDDPTGPKASAFSIQYALSQSWKICSGRLGLLIMAGLLSFGIGFALELVAGICLEHEKLLFTGLLLYIFAKAAEAILCLGLIRICLDLCAFTDTRLSRLFSCVHLIFRYFFSSVLFYVALLIGFMLLFVPGVIVAARLSLYPFLIVERDSGPIAALEESWELTAGATLRLILLQLALLLIVLAGALFFLVGLLISIPLAFLAQAFVYRTLLARAQRGHVAGVVQPDR